MQNNKSKKIDKQIEDLRNERERLMLEKEIKLARLDKIEREIPAPPTPQEDPKPRGRPKKKKKESNEVTKSDKDLNQTIVYLTNLLGYLEELRTRRAKEED